MTAQQEFVVPRSIPTILSTENAAQKGATIQVRDRMRTDEEELQFKGGKEIIKGAPMFSRKRC